MTDQPNAAERAEPVSDALAERLIGVVMGSKDADEYAAQLETEVRTLRAENERAQRQHDDDEVEIKHYIAQWQQTESALASEREKEVARYEAVVEAARYWASEEGRLTPATRYKADHDLLAAVTALDATNEGAQP